MDYGNQAVIAEQEQFIQECNIRWFEEELAKLQANGAQDLGTAIWWLIQAEGKEEDVADFGRGVLEYHLGLPIEYFASTPELNSAATYAEKLAVQYDQMESFDDEIIWE